AKQNAQVNHIDNVNIYSSDCYEHVDNDKKFGLILTNPPIRAGKKVVNEILLGANEHLVNGGILLVVIQKKQGEPSARKDRKSTRLNSSHVSISYAVFCLKK